MVIPVLRDEPRAQWPRGVLLRAERPETPNLRLVQRSATRLAMVSPLVTGCLSTSFPGVPVLSLVATLPSGLCPYTTLRIS